MFYDLLAGVGKENYISGIIILLFDSANIDYESSRTGWISKSNTRTEGFFKTFQIMLFWNTKDRFTIIMALHDT